MTAAQAPPDYGLAVALAVLIAACLLVPGICWNLYASRPARLSFAAMPLPGLLFLAVAGVLFWADHLPRGLIAALIVAVPHSACLVAVMVRWRSIDRDTFGGNRGIAAYAAWGAIVVCAITTGINPLPVAQESYDGFALPGRMVASPPDSITPFSSASYMSAGYNGHDMRAIYFGSEWSIASRGPLAPLAILSLFREFENSPNDPPGGPISSWPVTPDGVFTARVLGWLLNGMVVLALARLMVVLMVPKNGYLFGLTWAVLAPSLVVNTLFLWPKLLAAYFVIMAISSIIEADFAIAGAMAALAYLSHPVGFIFLPSFAALSVWRTGIKPLPLRKAGNFVLTFVGLLLPWLIYKAWLGEPDPFISYILAAGDPPNAAKSIGQWLSFRLTTLRITLVPVAFFFSDYVTSWYTGPLQPILRWDVQYTKTLPGALGYSTYLLAYISVYLAIRNGVNRALALSCILLPFVVMLMVDGFSSDGLGRNSMEPLVPLIIVLSVSVIELPRALQLGLTSALWAEVVWLNVSGVVYADNFSWQAVPPSAYVLWMLSALSLATFAIWARPPDPRAAPERRHGPRDEEGSLFAQDAKGVG